MQLLESSQSSEGDGIDTDTCDVFGLPYRVSDMASAVTSAKFTVARPKHTPVATASGKDRQITRPCTTRSTVATAARLTAEEATTAA